jgi:hypothetical protein
MADPILAVDYDASWPIKYEQEKIRILSALGNTVADIKHIGSTWVCQKQLVGGMVGGSVPCRNMIASQRNFFSSRKTFTGIVKLTFNLPFY